MRTRIGAALLALACGLATAPVYAQEPPATAGADALAAARAAWGQKHFKDAEPLYKSALDHGGLAPADTLDAYVHLGAARASLGRKDLARAAFRQAALIDAHFHVPREAGKRAATIAALAKRDEKKLGSIALNAAIPQSVPSGETFSIDATLDARHAGVTAKIGIDARAEASGKHWSTNDVAAPTVHFEVPADLATPGATLVVRVDALDPHDNRLATREQRIHVEGVEAPPIALFPKTPVAAPPEAPAALTFDLDGPKRTKDKRESGEHGGFWSSPWPYFIGGLVLAAGGAVTYYELRPTDDVSLGAAHVTTR